MKKTKSSNNNQSLANKTILLIISGGVSAYKALELIRLIRKAGGRVRCILSKGGEQFVTPLSVSSLSGEQVYTDLWSLKDETEIGHIRLSREADLIVITPASANLIAKMAHGLADDLASTTLLAADKPIIIAPAMNHMMWGNPATQENVQKLQSRGIIQIGPAMGEMACNESGIGRMAEPEDIFDNILAFFREEKPLSGYKALVTSGPTYEPLDPVRFIGNRSSGKQGHAIAAALAEQGATVTLVTGPVALPDPAGVHTIHVETAAEMLEAAQNTLPVEIAICAAAVSDWTAKTISAHKIKKQEDNTPPALNLKENPDILATLSRPSAQRPPLVIGFAAETEDLLDNAKNKLTTKGCDWIIANDVGGNEKVFGSDKNHVYLVTKSGHEDWQPASKNDIARKLALHIAGHFEERHYKTTQKNIAAE